VIVIGERHARIVKMACAMPDTILLLDTHVAHLYRQEVVQNRLPYAALIDVSSYTEGLRGCVAVGDFVDAGFGNLCEVKLNIFVAQEISPGRGLSG
jgi:hypothetical protein